MMCRTIARWSIWCSSLVDLNPLSLHLIVLTRLAAEVRLGVEISQEVYVPDLYKICMKHCGHFGTALVSTRQCSLEARHQLWYVRCRHE